MPYIWLPYLLAISISFYELFFYGPESQEYVKLDIDSSSSANELKDNKKSRSIVQLLSEELLNLGLLLFLMPSGFLSKMFIHGSLAIWALLHVSDLCAECLAHK
jgi:hypothetical protein